MSEKIVVKRTETVNEGMLLSRDYVSYLCKPGLTSGTTMKTKYWTNLPEEVQTFDTIEDAELAAFNAAAASGSAGLVSVGTLDMKP